MKKIVHQLSPLLIPIVLVLWGGYTFYALYPPASFLEDNFSDFNLLHSQHHVEEIAKSPHYVGSGGHAITRNYIINQLESFGLEVHTQTAVSYTKSGVVSIPQNIIAKIPGTISSNKALLIMSHYDAAVHSSLGAADAGSGVAIILETVRYFLDSNTEHLNDIIICITDGEEIGLNGAYLFAKEHPWASKVGLALNFEARGASGPSNMLLETNSGNAGLISTFKKAKVNYPVANSLMYSIYKLLPNDTDSTIFREDLNVPSFFFAFIDAHYIYHTALDTPKNLSKKSLNHQAAYLLQLLPYYANTDLEMLSSDKDMIYFDFPFVDLLSYPFSWSFPIWVFTLMLFLLLLYVAKKNNQAPNLKSLLFALLLHLGFLILAGGLGYFIWDVLLYFYPNYALFLQGFTYNGHFYIFAVATLGFFISIAFVRFVATKYGILTSSMGSHLVWLIITFLLIVFLNGASYLIVPVVFSILISLIQCFSFKFKHIVQLLCAFPVVAILIPFVQFFPVGLGLQFLFASLVLTILISYLLSPLFFQLKQTRIIYSILIVFIVIGIAAGHTDSKFSESYPRPSSLVYMQSNDEAFYGIYETNLSPWNNSITKGLDEVDPTSFIRLPSKYANIFERLFKAPIYKTEIAEANVYKDANFVTIELVPSKNSSRLELFLDNPHTFKNITVNGKQFKGNLHRHNFLLAYYVVGEETITITLELGKETLNSLQLYETSYQLVPNKKLKIPIRPLDEMAMPFVTSDAIITHQTLVL